MIIDNERQRAVLLELIARAHRAPSEVPVIEELRTAIANATVPEPEPVTDGD